MRSRGHGAAGLHVRTTPRQGSPRGLRAPRQMAGGASLRPRTSAPDGTPAVGDGHTGPAQPGEERGCTPSPPSRGPPAAPRSTRAGLPTSSARQWVRHGAGAATSRENGRGCSARSPPRVRSPWRTTRSGDDSATLIPRRARVGLAFRDLLVCPLVQGRPEPPEATANGPPAWSPQDKRARAGPPKGRETPRRTRTGRTSGPPRCSAPRWP